MMLEGLQTRRQQIVGHFPAVLNGLRWFGPAFLVSVGYMDPGNWATDIEGGSRFSYQLLWVILASSLIAIFLQILSAKLGIATGKGLAENSRDTYPRPVRLALWVIMEVAMIATDLAEFMGSALGISLLFHIPLLPAVLITGFDVLFILWLERFGFRVVEIVIIGLVTLVGWAYVIEILMVQPTWSQVFSGMVIPTWNPNSLLVAVGILGATVMPHNLFLHSTQIKTRLTPDADKRRVLRMARLDTFVALNAAWLVNSAILIVSAAVFFRNGQIVTDIDQAYHTLSPLAGPLAAGLFAVALLASGISSSVTGTMAGQIVMEEFLHLKVAAWKRRIVTRLIVIVPTVIAIAAHAQPLQLLVVSQVALSVLLPFAMIPLIDLTRRKKLMGEFRNSRLTTIAASAILIFIIGANVLMLWSQFTSA
jgi:manganese transport protein